VTLADTRRRVAYRRALEPIVSNRHRHGSPVTAVEFGVDVVREPAIGYYLGQPAQLVRADGERPTGDDDVGTHASSDVACCVVGVNITPAPKAGDSRAAVSASLNVLVL
jgi:hypothetical protein